MLFGYPLEAYDVLFEEKLDLLLKIRDNETVTWSGKTRAPINNLPVYPRPVQDPLPVWIAAGGTPRKAVRHSGSTGRHTQSIIIYACASQVACVRRVPVGSAQYVVK